LTTIWAAAARINRACRGTWREGDVDWPGQIAALHAESYPGMIAVEPPHLAPSVACTRAVLGRLDSLIKAAKAAGE
jgi:sugar phosphate isomerase/epimerase